MSHWAHIYYFTSRHTNQLAQHKFSYINKLFFTSYWGWRLQQFLIKVNKGDLGILTLWKQKLNQEIKHLGQNCRRKLRIRNYLSIVFMYTVHILNSNMILSFQAPAFSSNISPIPSSALDLHWSNYAGWPPTGRLSKGPLKINIHSFRSVIRFWHYRPCSSSALPLSVLYSSIYPPSQP